MTRSATTDRRAAKTAHGVGERTGFYGDKAVLRSPEGAVPIIIEHHVARAQPRRSTCITTSTTASTSSRAAGHALRRLAFVVNTGDYVSPPSTCRMRSATSAPRKRCCCRHTTPTHSSRLSAASAFPAISRSQIQHRSTTQPWTTWPARPVSRCSVRPCPRRKHGRSSLAAGERRHARDQRPHRPLTGRGAARMVAVEILSSRILLRPADLGRSRHFYRDVLGLAVYREFGSPAIWRVVFFLGPGFLESLRHRPGPAGQPVMIWLQVRDIDRLSTSGSAEAGVRIGASL